jgi:hypothetical protein
VLTVTYFRIDPDHTSYASSLPFSTAIPFDLPEEKIKGLLDDFVRRAAPAPLSTVGKE